MKRSQPSRQKEQPESQENLREWWPGNQVKEIFQKEGNGQACQVRLVRLKIDEKEYIYIYSNIYLYILLIYIILFNIIIIIIYNYHYNYNIINI